LSDLISVIVPAYNAEKLIENTLNSVLNQTYKNFEVIVVNDGSKDRTKEICESFVRKDTRFKHVYQDNAGVSMARNKGIELSQGKYICFLDADDYFDKTYLEKMHLSISSGDCDICYCGISYIYVNKGKEKKLKTRFTQKKVLINAMSGKIKWSIIAIMFNKDFLKKNNILFRRGLSSGEDTEFGYLAFASSNKICFVSQYLVYSHRGHSATQLSTLSLDMIDLKYESYQRLILDDRIRINKRNENLLLNFGLNGATVRRLNNAIKQNFDKEEIIRYYDKYADIINKYTFNNGLRSIKLNYVRFKLIQTIKKWKKELGR